jgi:hypothetical protein
MTPTDIFSAIVFYLPAETVANGEWSSMIGLTKHGILVVAVGNGYEDRVVLGSWDSWTTAHRLYTHLYRAGAKSIAFHYIVLDKPLAEKRYQCKFRTKSGKWIEPPLAIAVDDGSGNKNLLINVRNPLTLRKPKARAT